MRRGQIVLRNVSKRYRRGERQLHRSLSRWLRRAPASDEFWALRDISLTIEPGETVGLIGANAAGKSTLLKIIAGITSATSGHAAAEGRIGSLIELGAGFHPELTGRENLSLLGTLLGFSRSEVRSRLDEIVAFADIGPFLDTPVKRYSSGMQARLGFAIAISVEPDILLIDEALAVGDAAFQEKCLARIDDVRRSGTTMLFVSHIPDLLARVCEKILWLDQGVVHAEGTAKELLPSYAQWAVREHASARP